jgi:hypothetical protein
LLHDVTADGCNTGLGHGKVQQGAAAAAAVGTGSNS